MRASDKAYAALRDDIIEWRLPARHGARRGGAVRAAGHLPHPAAGGPEPAHGRRADDDGGRPRRRRHRYFPGRTSTSCSNCAKPSKAGPPRWPPSAATPRPSSGCGDELLRAPELIGAQDPARHDYYGLVGRLDAAIDAAISNSYLAQAMRSLRVHLVRVRRLAADDAARLTAAAAEHAAIAEAIAAGNPRLAEAATTLHLHRSLSHVKATHTPHQKEHHG